MQGWNKNSSWARQLLISYHVVVWVGGSRGLKLETISPNQLRSLWRLFAVSTLVIIILFLILLLSLSVNIESTSNLHVHKFLAP